ncbi:YbaB/EbfC family nucleoid-associated protein [Nonomuraea lactucae]|uniref:YbaB/EbfC family nucleoid-associated protein n=1 Tax=Nonomuraea lactucae TaxID=2249762 RepID=UPI000DE37628|nr:YbaB/EbfC family nucleoid-associated protein [Nonomuraea lactucae]
MYETDIDPANIREQDVAEAQRQAEAARALLTDQESVLEEIVGEGGGDGGHVRATAAADGRVLEVVIDPRAMSEGSEALGEQILLAVRRAQDDAGRQAGALLRESLREALPSVDTDLLQERLRHLLQ